MSFAPAPGLLPVNKDPLMRLAQSLSGAQDRESYAALVSYIHSLQPTDELAKVAQLFGFLTLMGHELPEAIASEQAKLRELLFQAHADFQKEVQTSAGYHDRLNERLSRLPSEIAAGVRPEAIAKTMSESFRQQILQSGLQDTQKLLAGSVGDLRRTTQGLDEAVKPLSERYTTLAGQIDRQARDLETQGNSLVRTAETIQRKNNELLAEMRSLHWTSVLALGIVALLVGVFAGITWEQRNVASLVGDLQNQISQFQQELKAAAPPAIQPPAKQLKKK
jgi:hypothetical protein